MTRGIFITFEGGEGAGKSTQVRLLIAALKRVGIAAEATREPGGSLGGEAIRRLLLEGGEDRWDALAEALLLYAARRDHVERLIAPALAAGRWVVSDRFADSTLAYQGYGKGISIAVLRQLHKLALGDFEPDLTVILDLPVKDSMARAAARGVAADRFERLGPVFHEKLRDGFRAIAAEKPQRCVLIDGTADSENVHRAVLAAVTMRLGVVVP